MQRKEYRFLRDGKGDELTREGDTPVVKILSLPLAQDASGIRLGITFARRYESRTLDTLSGGRARTVTGRPFDLVTVSAD